MPVGIAVAVATATVTCVVVAALMGRLGHRQAPPAPAPTALPTPDAGPDAEADASADGPGDGPDAGSVDGDIDGPLTQASPPEADAPAKLADGPDCTLPDRDIAREAWRHNLPTICVARDGRKASMYLPIKGTLRGAAAGVHRRPVREARIDLPNADSLLTMAQYKLDRDGFADLRPTSGRSGGTTFRIKLQNDAGDPVFELKDTYAKVTVGRPAEH